MHIVGEVHKTTAIDARFRDRGIALLTLTGCGRTRERSLFSELPGACAGRGFCQTSCQQGWSAPNFGNVGVRLCGLQNADRRHGGAEDVQAAMVGGNGLMVMWAGTEEVAGHRQV